MRLLPTHALLAAALLCPPTAAYADTPVLSGSYTMTLETICPATQDVNAIGKRLKITPTSPGEISHLAGTLNFFNSGGRSGTFKSSSATTDGSAILSTVNHKKTGTRFSLVDGQNFGAYSMGDNTLTLTYDQQPHENFDAVYGNVDSNSIVQTADLLRVTGDATPCATHVLLHLQQPSGR